MSVALGQAGSCPGGHFGGRLVWQPGVLATNRTFTVGWDTASSCHFPLERYIIPGDQDGQQQVNMDDRSRRKSIFVQRIRNTTPSAIALLLSTVGRCSKDN